jgi:hypothetical protein
LSKGVFHLGLRHSVLFQEREEDFRFRFRHAANLLSCSIARCCQYSRRV